jgi:hypothetical protein
MTVAEQRDHDRQNVAIEAVADALLAVCALQTGLDPMAAASRAQAALVAVLARAEAEAWAEAHGGER